MIYVENLNINNCPKRTTNAGGLTSVANSEPCNTLPHFSDEAAFNRNARPPSETQNLPFGRDTQNLPLSLMPPTANNHEASVRSNSISSISGESANETELSCTTPSPSSAGSVVPNTNTLTSFHVNPSQVNISQSNHNTSECFFQYLTHF